MFIFGHLGIGSKIVSPWTHGLPRRAVLVGTILPDLIDKPLYVVAALVTGRQGAEIGLISGTRTFAHTAIFLIALSFGALVRRSKILAALAAGIATHLFLDNLSDHFHRGGPVNTALMAMTWPISSTSFPAMAPTLSGYIQSFTPFLIGAEVVGLALLGWDQWKLAYEGEILEATQERRRFFKRIKKTRKAR
jgi:hypothetical protein